MIMTHKCKSGQHAWLFREDAAKCCAVEITLTEMTGRRERETGRTVLVGFRLGRGLEGESDAAATAHEDLRCFGAVVYRILVGQMPPEPPTHDADVASSQDEEAILRARLPPDAPEGLASILARLFAPRPKDRYASAEAVAADLRALVPDGIGRRGTAPDASAAATAVPDVSEWEARALGVHETLAVRWLRILRGWTLARLQAAWAKSQWVRRRIVITGTSPSMSSRAKSNSPAPAAP